MSAWDEIKRLAADFQKVQLSSTLQKYVNQIFNLNFTHTFFYFIFQTF